MPTAPPIACLVPGCPGHASFLGRCEDHAAPVRAEQARRRQAEPGRRLYATQRWRRLRLSLLARAPLCVHCTRDGRVMAATEIDHVQAHKGDPARFWAVDNLQPLCHAHHVEKTRQERQA